MNHSHTFIKVLGIAIALGSTATLSPLLNASPAIAQTAPQAQTDANLLFNRGVQKIQQQDFQGAVSDFTALIEREPQNANAYLGRAIAYRNQRNFAEAIKDYDESLRLNPTNANAYFGRGISKYSTQDLRGAIEDYTAALRYNDSYGQAYYNRAVSRVQLGDRQGAIADFRRAAELYRTQELTQYYQDALARIAELESTRP